MKKRKASDVALQLVDIVPADSKDNMKWFSEEFKKLDDKICFETLQTFLYKIIGPLPNKDWHYKALSILTNRSINKIKKFAKELHKRAEEIKNECKKEESNDKT